MNAILCVGVLMCAYVVYATPLPAAAPTPEVHVEAANEEGLQAEESRYGHHHGGWGHRGYGHGYGGGYGFGGGWGGGYGGGYGGGHGGGYGGGFGGGHGGGYGGGYGGGWGRGYGGWGR